LNGLSSPAIYYKGTLIFMNNFYHKLAVTSVFTALSFTLGTNKEAKAGSIPILKIDGQQVKSRE
jgi:hypothetical protein